MHHRRAGRRAVASPQLAAVDAIIGAESEDTLDNLQADRHRAVGGRAGINVLDQDRARPCAVALPQLGPVNTVIGGEVKPPAHTRQLTDAKWSYHGETAEERRPSGCPIAFPQGGTVPVVVGDVEGVNYTRQVEG